LSPLTVPVSVTGSHNLGEQIDYAVTNLAQDLATLHPVKVYSADNTTFLGVGKYATAFGSGISSSSQFGTGANGNLTVPLGQTVYTDSVRAALGGNNVAGQPTVIVASTAGFAAG